MITEDMGDCRMLISNNARLMYLFLIQLTTFKSDTAHSHAPPLLGKGREGRRQSIGVHERKQNHNERFQEFFRRYLTTYETNLSEYIKLMVALFLLYGMLFFYMSSSNAFPSLQTVNNVSLFPFYLIRKTGLITVSF